MATGAENAMNPLIIIRLVGSSMQSQKLSTLAMGCVIIHLRFRFRPASAAGSSMMP